MFRQWLHGGDHWPKHDIDVTADQGGGATSPLSVRSAARQQARVLDHLRIGREEGAEVVIGGGRLGGEAYDRGFFVEPTIFDRVAPDMQIAQEEIFDPVPSGPVGRRRRTGAERAGGRSGAPSGIGKPARRCGAQPGA
ncbi:aldehyde dehydrogenase family protein [Streptomyces sp. ATE26]|uniref:aldehyde dehydrogenase family protein n=1 Tax=unclassified Streptomyces TaxID=2593676 RepID=UPI00117E44E3